jgi:hypothetical protein
MKNTLALILGLSVICAANAQPVDVPFKKVAVVSLIGDSITVDTYRRRVGTSIDANNQTTVRLPTPEFDHVALLTAESTLTKLLPATSSIAPLAVPAADSDSDPARLTVDGKVSPSNPLIAALRQGNFTHLLTVSKHRAAARLQLSGLTVGSGYLRGLGFYIDNDLPTRNLDTGKTGRGFVAPYVFIKLVLVDLASLEVQSEQAITASTSRSAADNEQGADPWGSMTAEDKVSVLKRLTEERIAAALPELFRLK